MPTTSYVPIQTIDKLKVLVEKIEILPTTPHIALQILDITNNPDSSARDLEEILKHDPALTAKILSFANSPFYGCAKKVIKLSSAVSLIGFNTIKNITIGLSVFDCFKDTHNSLVTAVNDLYLHSFTVGLAAEQLVKKCPSCDPEPAFLSGFFHDIGKMVLIRLLDKNYKNILEIAEDKNVPVAEIERQVLGFDHTDAGAWILETWGLPEIFIHITSAHHRVNYESPPLTLLVSLADALANHKGTRCGDEYILPDTHSVILDILSLTNDDLQETADRIDHKAKEGLMDMAHI